MWWGPQIELRARQGCGAGAEAKGGQHRWGLSLCPQAMVMEQATQGSNPPELRVQYLRQIHANHEVRHHEDIPPEASVRAVPGA